MKFPYYFFLNIYFKLNVKISYILSYLCMIYGFWLFNNSLILMCAKIMYFIACFFHYIHYPLYCILLLSLSFIFFKIGLLVICVNFHVYLFDSHSLFHQLCVCSLLLTICKSVQTTNFILLCHKFWFIILRLFSGNIIVAMKRMKGVSLVYSFCLNGISILL